MAASIPLQGPLSLSCDDYTIGWISALAIESAAAAEMLDTEHESLLVAPGDNNDYVLGKIGNHKVVMACINEAGGLPANVVTTNLMRSFRNVRYILMVGIGGGIPSEKCQIRLGDIVISEPSGKSPGVVQSDFGKWETDGFKIKGSLNRPAEGLIRVMGAMKRLQIRNRSKIHSFVKHFPGSVSDPEIWKYQGRENDPIYKTDLEPRQNGLCPECITQPKSHAPDPKVHYGIIASGNQVINNREQRDKLRDQLEACCVEMEAFGLMNYFPCLVIRGISDYADGRKDDKWQPYAALTAAAYGKELLLSLPSVQDTPKMSEQLEKLENKINVIGEKLDVFRHVQEGTMAMVESEIKIKNWLSPSDPSTNFNEAKRKRHEGTGSWFLESELFKEWKSGSRQYLWLYGIPGCGKTVLSSTIIEHLRQNQESSSHVVLDFFFDFKNAKKLLVDDLVRSLIAQLYSKCKNSRKELDKRFSSCEDGRRQPELESLFATFQQMMDHVEKIQVVIDALDECENRKDLLLWIKKLSGSRNTKVCLLITSRKEEEIESGLGCWLYEENFVPIQRGPVDSDIRSYIRATLRADNGFQRWRLEPSVLEEIETELMKKADGMFRWATCQLDSLEECLDLGELREALSSLPESLDETYARILTNITEKRRKRAIRILQFLAYSEQPLTIEEVVDAIVVDPNRDPQFDPKLRLPVPREVLKICSSLVSLVTRQDNYNMGKTVTELQLAHFSVKEYLTSERVKATFKESFTEISARRSITRVCLAYLSHLDEKRPLEEIKVAFRLAEYSARYWMGHARPVETEKDLQESILKFFLQQRQAYTMWICLLNSGEEIGTPLYYASLAGLGHTVKSLLEKGADVNAPGEGQFGTALQAASYGGHDQVVQRLLEEGADVNAPGGGLFGTALQEASHGGHDQVVQRLLKKGANVNAPGGGRSSTALQGASYGGHDQIVQRLLEEGADVNAPGGGWYGTALQGASYGGHDQIVQRLLEEGADVNAPGGGRYGTALQAASYGGHDRIVQRLLEEGAIQYP